MKMNPTVTLRVLILPLPSPEGSALRGEETLAVTIKPFGTSQDRSQELFLYFKAFICFFLISTPKK